MEDSVNSFKNNSLELGLEAKLTFFHDVPNGTVIGLVKLRLLLPFMKLG